jgi:tRNA threonylcarbamoyladenosine biosynthesis protein TsaE
LSLNGLHALIVETSPSSWLERHSEHAAGRLLHWPDEAATQAFAQRLAALPALRNALIELHGDLGAGKTTLVRHVLRALGVQGRIKSPSYAVVEPYSVATALGELNIWHFDLYRFADPREFEEAGFRDLLASPGLKLVEWPDKARGVLPQPDLALHITANGDDSRQVRLEAFTPVGQELLA